MPDDRNFWEDDSLPPDGEQSDDRGLPRPPWEAKPGARPPEPQDVAPTPAPWELHPGEIEPAPQPPQHPAPWSAPRSEAGSLDDLRQQAGGWDTWNLSDDEPADTPSDQPDEPIDDMAWMRAFGEAAGTEQPVPPEEEDDLAWLGRVEPGQEPPHEDEPATQRRVDPSELPWVDQETFRRIPNIEPDAELLLSPEDRPPAEPADDLPDWLSEEFGEEFGAEPPAEAPSEPSRVIQPLTSRLRPPESQPFTEESPAEDEMPAWLSEIERPGQAAEDAPPPQTFEEWERQQEERAREESKTDEDRLLESVPDWLEKLPDQPEPPAAASELPASEPEFMPGWFLGLEEQPEEEAPDWFQKLDYSTDPLAAPPEPPTTPSPSDEDEVPDWFKGIGAPGAETLPEPDLSLFADEAAPFAAEPPGHEGDFVERFDPIAPDEYGTSEGDMPDWLLDLDQEEPPATPAPASTTPFASEPAPAEDSLDWLSDLSPEDLATDPTYQALFGAEPPPSEQPPTEEPTALADAELEQLLESYEAPPQVPVAPEIEVSDLADEAALFAALDQAMPAEAEPALDEFFPDVGTGQPVPSLERLFDEPAPGEVPAAEAATEARPPDWIEDLRPADLPVTVRAGGVEVDVPQTPVVELPPRIHTLRDRAIRELETPATPPAPAEAGALAGLSSVLERFDTALPAVQPTGPLSGAVVTREQQVRVQKLQALMAAAEEPEEAPTAQEALEVQVAPGVAARKVRRARRFKVDRVLVALLMLAALIIPFASDVVHVAESPPPLGAAGKDLAAELDALTPGAYVLIALEYGPTAAGELDPLVEAVLRDAFVQGAVPLTISTNIAGALHAESIFARLADDEALLSARSGEEDPAPLRAGRDYVVLSYLPGDALGVRTLAETYGEAGEIHPAFATNLRGENTRLPIHSVADDLALIVVAGEETDDVRAWAEQLRGLGVPKVALVTAALEPLITPYVYDEGYAGYLAGVRDAYSYNLARNANARSTYTLPDGLGFDLPHPEDARWHSMALGAATAATLITLGMVVNLLRALVRRRA